MNVPTRSAFVALQRAAEETARADRFRDRSVTVTHHVTGELERHIAKGGIYNATDLQRAAHGVSREDVAHARLVLRDAGYKVSIAETEALLIAAIRGEVTVTDSTAAERMRRRRQKAREAKLCIVNPKHGSPGAGRVTCAQCQADAIARQARIREANRPIADDDGADLPPIEDLF